MLNLKEYWMKLLEIFFKKFENEFAKFFNKCVEKCLLKIPRRFANAV